MGRCSGAMFSPIDEMEEAECREGEVAGDEEGETETADMAVLMVDTVDKLSIDALFVIRMLDMVNGIPWDSTSSVILFLILLLRSVGSSQSYGKG